MALDISVIIPSNHGHYELINNVRLVCNQTLKPFEILIVDSSPESGACPIEIMELCALSGIDLIYEHRKCALPGYARNIGLGKATRELIAFIDVHTLARPNWLEASLAALVHNGADGVWGATCFSAQTAFERLVRDGFYGVIQRNTLPGSIFKRDVFLRVGQFIDWVRAGEDTEWILRVELLKVPVVNSSSPMIDYVGLIGLDLNKLIHKWYRNYTASRDLPHLFPLKLILWMAIYPLLILLALNWNNLIADWRMDSLFYVGHLTKMIVILPVVLYLTLRGFLLPFLRGIRIGQLLPIRFLAIALICATADIVKILVLTIPKNKNVINVRNFKG
jgi:glycosyltransferase involved in cell wall biosynthesis